MCSFFISVVSKLRYHKKLNRRFDWQHDNTLSDRITEMTLLDKFLTSSEHMKWYSTKKSIGLNKINNSNRRYLSHSF